MLELTPNRQENSKTFDLGNKQKRVEVHIGAIHYKENYLDKQEAWKDIDLTWNDNVIGKSPFILTHEGSKLTIYNRKTKETSTIELLEIGGKKLKDKAWIRTKANTKNPDVVTLEGVALDTDLEINIENERVRFTRILKSDKSPKEAKFRITGNWQVRASDEDGEIETESGVSNGVLTETLKPQREVKYPVRIDPTYQVGASTDDCYRSLYFGGGTYWALTSTNYGAGCGSSQYNRYGGGARFTNITIPAGSTIDTTYMTLRCNTTNNTGTVCRTRFSAEDVDDAPTFADDSAAFDARWSNRTTAIMDWDGIATWTKDTDYNTPTTDGVTTFASIIQEVIDRGGWASGQDIVVFWEDFDDRSDHNALAYRSAYSYDGSATYAPQLIIEYTEGGGEETVVTPGVIAQSLTEYISILKEHLTPTTLSLSDTQFVPVLKEQVTPSLLTLSDTQYVPILKEQLTPATLTLVDTQYIPVLKHSIISGLASLASTKYIPILMEKLTPTTLALSGTEYTPILKEQITPSTLPLATAKYTPVLNLQVTPSLLALLDTEYTPVLELFVVPPVKALALTEYTPVLGFKYIIPKLDLTLAGFIPLLPGLGAFYKYFGLFQKWTGSTWQTAPLKLNLGSWRIGRHISRWDGS